jgi:hypothetical protein
MADEEPGNEERGSEMGPKQPASTRLGVPPKSPQPKPKSPDFIEGYREGHADGEKGKDKKY